MSAEKRNSLQEPAGADGLKQPEELQPRPTQAQDSEQDAKLQELNVRTEQSTALLEEGRHIMRAHRIAREAEQPEQD